MSKTTALEIMKNNAEQIASDSVQHSQTQNDLNELHLAFGAIGGMRIISTFIGVSTIKVLQQVRDKEQYKALGFANFKDFLEQSTLAQQYAGISYRTFNNLENQMLAEGEQLYELLNQFRIPISTRQLLAKNGEIEIALDGDKLQIGGETYDLESTNVKEVIKDLAKETKRLSDNHAQSEKQIEQLKTQVETGTNELQELQRAVDAQATGTRYEQAFAKAFNAILNLNIVTRETPIIEKETRGRGDVDALWKQMLIFRDESLQADYSFIDDAQIIEQVKGKKGISKKAMQAIAETGDDFGDDLEG